MKNIKPNETQSKSSAITDNKIEDLQKKIINLEKELNKTKVENLSYFFDKITILILIKDESKSLKKNYESQVLNNIYIYI